MFVFKRFSAVILVFVLALFCFSKMSISADEPVRLAITAESGSGIEQEIVDYITAHFEETSDVVLSTVNPDWYVKCKIIDNQDRMSGQIRYNGTVTVKTTDGQVVATVSVQKYNQDFSNQIGTPLNKQLVDSAAREVISVVGQRATEKIQEAIETELKTREQIRKAEAFANDDKYDNAIAVARQISRDSVHYQASQKKLSQYKVEKNSLQLISDAEFKAKQAQYVGAIDLLTGVDAQSKRQKLSKQLIKKYRAALAAASRRAQAKKLVKNSGDNKDNNATRH